MASASDLSDVPADTLFKEVLRRLKCSVKPEKRIILVGEMYYQFFNRRARVKPVCWQSMLAASDVCGLVMCPLSASDWARFPERLVLENVFLN